jgi:Zn-dependent protease with chaperone function
VSEAIFPVLGPLVVLLVALPVAALLAKLVLATLGCARSSVLHEPLGLRYSVLVGSSLVPLVWFGSAALHQAETSRHAAVCGSGHAPEDACFEAGFFALALTVVVLSSLFPPLWHARYRPPPARDAAADAQAARIDAIVARAPALRSLSICIEVWTNAAAAIATEGLVTPRIVVRTGFAAMLDDEALAAALHHEVAHVRARDPFRYALVDWALSIQPFGRRLLGGELAQWVVAREAHCDRDAVLAGADPRALAHALVVAAREGTGVRPVGLGATAIDVLRLRVELLLAYAEQMPQQQHHRRVLAPTLMLLGFATAMPHVAGTQALDVVHVVAERTVSTLAGN